MEDQLVSFETAKLAQEKGFNINVVDKIVFQTIPDFLVPTQSLLQKWLREIHELDVYVISEDNGTYWYNLHGENINPKDYKLKMGEEELYNSVYEEALEVGLQEALKLI